MGAYKQFLASDIIITPLTLNKFFYFTGSSALTSSNVGIDRFIGLNTGSLFDPLTDPTTGQITTQYQRLIYDSVKQLYYSNFLNSTSSYGSPVNTASLFPGNNEAGNVLVGTTSSAGRYYNYPQTNLTFEKYFQTETDSQIGVISIPESLYGNYIQPNSFFIKSPSGSIYDDGQGNLIFQNPNQICGNIFYGHGIAVITKDSQPASGGYGEATYGTSSYGQGGNINIINTFINSSNITCSFSSSLTIYETQYKCTVRENEFNFSQNPSILSGSNNEILYDFATGSYFQPYITTVGLYNEQKQLLAIGKLSQPLPLSPTTDTTILISIDR
jgi:hypothetical protein